MNGYARPDDDTVERAYIYLLSRALVVRQEHTDRAGDNFAYNKAIYNPLGSAAFVNPNLDVAYLEAWFGVDKDHAVILNVPEVHDRYYTAQILDEWGEAIVNINDRATPAKPFGKYALVLPGSAAALPSDAARIELHSAKAKMLARVELGGDPDGALKLQRAFTVEAPEGIEVADPPQLPEFDNESLIGVELFDSATELVASAADVSPVAASMQMVVQQVAAFVAESAANRKHVDQLIRGTIIPNLKEYTFTKSAPYINGWVGGAHLGNYGSDYYLRTVVDYAGIWGNTAEEALYFVCTHDSNGQALTGASSYTIHFPADGLPETVVNSYWSVILIGLPDLRVVANDLDRYNFNSYSDLVSNSDGAHPASGVPEANWLAADPAKPFSLTLRTYVPKDFVADGGWAPPAVTPAT